MQLINEEIERVWYTYYGCPYTFKDLSDINGKNHIYFFGKDYISRLAIEQNFEDCKLQLTPLSKDAIEVAKMLYENATDIEDRDLVLKSLGEIFATITLKDGGNVHHHPFKIISVYQYLISKGYAVPLWFGVGHWANGKTAIELEIAQEK